MGELVLKTRTPHRRALRTSVDSGGHHVERGVNRTDKNPLATLKARKRRGRSLRERSLLTRSAQLGDPVDRSRLAMCAAELNEQLEHCDGRRRAIRARRSRRLDMADRRMLERAGDQVIS